MAGRGRVCPVPAVSPRACDQGLCADCPPDPASPGLSAPHLQRRLGCFLCPLALLLSGSGPLSSALGNWT